MPGLTHAPSDADPDVGMCGVPIDDRTAADYGEHTCPACTAADTEGARIARGINPNT